MEVGNEKEAHAVVVGDGASTNSPSSDRHNHSKSRDMDTALTYIQNARNGDGSSVNEKQLLRKIDWRIVPIMFACYTMQFIDKVLINVSPLLPDHLQT